LCIDSSAVAAHLAVGDHLGECHVGGKFNNQGNGNGVYLATTGAIKVYPNPTENLFNVEIPALYKDAQVMISDLNGKIIERRAIYDNNGQPLQFSLSNVARGIYVVKVFAGETTYVEKIIAR